MKETVCFAGMILSLCLAGCVGVHTLPDRETISSLDPASRQLSIAFDQRGHPYPAAEWSSFLPQGYFDWHQYHAVGKNRAFALQWLREGRSPLYCPDTDEALTREFARLLDESLVDRKRLIVFIHGFNNTHPEAMASIEALQGYVNTDEAAILNVYWDGLNGAGKWFKKLPVRWTKSMTYGNLAGQIGLRRVLNRLENPVELVFVTHSRGAAVAFSALFDPSYDSDIHAPGGVYPKLEHEDYERADYSRFRSIKMFMLAPAMGNGHLNSAMRNSLSELPGTELYVVANEKDYATCKWLFPGAAFGDSRLGCRADYIRDQKSKFREFGQVKFFYQAFSDAGKGYKVLWLDDSTHAIGAYMQQSAVRELLCLSGVASAEVKCEQNGRR